MENFAQYILNEKDLISKMEIEYYLSKKEDIFYDKSVLFKAELARLFMNFMEIDVDKNVVLTACLLCECKKHKVNQNIEKIRTYADEGAKFLKSIGFNNRMCKICSEVNRYSESGVREKEGDVLELVDQYGGMILDRQERKGFEPDEALVLLEYRNLKDKYNRYLNSFIVFAKEVSKIQIGDKLKVGTFVRLRDLHNMAIDVKDFIKKLAYIFEPEIDKEIQNIRDKVREKILDEGKNPNRALFSAETTRKIMGNIVTNDKDFKTQL